MKKVGIVIVNYNGERYQNDAIRSLYSMANNDFDIIVVDSASSDNSITMLREEFPEVHIIECDENVGVAKGNNIGIKYCIDNGYEYSLLMNNDIEVNELLLNELLNKADTNTVTVPKIYFYEPNNLLWFAGGKMSWNKGTSFHVGMREYDKDEYNTEKYIDYSPTCCMLIHNSIFEKIGLIDETVFMYFDDTDLCVRLIDNGIKILYVPAAYMWHKVSSSTGGENSKVSMYYYARNQLYFVKKYSSRMNLGAKIYVFTKYLTKAFLAPFRKAHKNDGIIFEAYKDYFSGNMGRKVFK